MHRIFNLTFIVGLILSIIASSGISLFQALTSELAGAITFSLLVNIMLVASGVIGLLSYFTVGSGVLKLVSRLSTKLHQVFSPIASALLGVIFGVILYSIGTQEWDIALKGSIIMFLVWGQVWMSTGYLRQSIYFINRRRTEDKTEALAILVVSCILLIFGVLGIWDMLINT